MIFYAFLVKYYIEKILYNIVNIVKTKMFLGLSISIREIHRILGLDMEIIGFLIMKKYKSNGEWIPNRYFIDEINKHLMECEVKMRLFPMNDICEYSESIIIGYKVPLDQHINVDEFVQNLAILKTQFMDEMATLGADLSEVMLDDEIIVKNPIPFIIRC